MPHLTTITDDECRDLTLRVGVGNLSSDPALSKGEGVSINQY